MAEENEVSKFLKNSCRIRDEPWQFNFRELLPGSCSARHPVNGMKCRRFMVYTGSVAELYIEPILSCIGDVDIMYYYSNELAILPDRPPPTQLPADFDSLVRVLKILDSNIPGYVHLVLTYILSSTFSEGKYVVDHVTTSDGFLNHAFYVTNEDASDVTIHGPACRFYYSDGVGLHSVVTDTVPCIRCLDWPTQAANWPTRQRDYEWPDSVTIDIVVSNGCDVVGVAHPICKDDDWMKSHQWRLSFSRAEVVLLNSWTTEQQVVYHMLRIFMKNERLTETSKEHLFDSLSNYHIKTLMLWSSELNPRHCWTNGSNLIRVCIKMINFFGEWLTKWRGQHYFTDKVYFSDYLDPLNIATVLAIAESTREDSLSSWLIHNYVRKCAELCPDKVSLLCCDPVSKTKIHEVFTTVHKWRDHLASKTILKRFFSQGSCFKALDIGKFQEQEIINYFINESNVGYRLFWQFLERLLKGLINGHVFVQNFSGLILSLFLDVFSLVGGECLLYDVANLGLWHSICFSGDQRRMSSYWQPKAKHDRRDGSISALTDATYVMKLTAQQQRKCTSLELAQIELSLVYLWKALRCRDSDNDYIYCVANVYSSILHYIVGRFQRAIDHCMLATRFQDHSRCRSLFVVKGELMPKIDYDIDSVLGLVTFHIYLRAAATGKEQYHDVRVFTAEVFAYYFIIKHLFVAKCRLAPTYSVQALKNSVCEQLIMLRNRLLNCESLFVSDLLLCKLGQVPTHDMSKDMFSIHNISDSECPEMLAEFSLEKLMKYGRPVLYRTISMNNVTEFLALSLYRCGLYEQCIELCQRNVLDIGADVPRLSTTYYEFVQLMDDAVVSLIGLSILVNRIPRRPKLEAIITVNQLILSLYLMTRSRINVHYSKLGFFLPACDVDVRSIVASMAETLDLVAEAEWIIRSVSSVDHWMLKLTQGYTMTVLREPR